LTQLAKYLEEKIQANGGCYVVGKSPTMADLALQGTVKGFQSGMLDHINKDFFDAYPGIMQVLLCFCFCKLFDD
jgi:glutathione S-transferase